MRIARPNEERKANELIDKVKKRKPQTCVICDKAFRISCEPPRKGLSVAVFHSCGVQIALADPTSEIKFLERGPDGEFYPSTNFTIGEP
jgi:hypothetical protein